MSISTLLGFTVYLYPAFTVVFIVCYFVFFVKRTKGFHGVSLRENIGENLDTDTEFVSKPSVDAEFAGEVPAGAEISPEGEILSAVDAEFAASEVAADSFPADFSSSETAEDAASQTVTPSPRRKKRRSIFFSRPHRMTRYDKVLALVLTLIYGALAFVGLGDMHAPQSFFRFTANEIVIDLGEDYVLSSVTYYTGNFHHKEGYTLTADGNTYSLEQTHATTFHWMTKYLGTDADGETVDLPYTHYVTIKAATTPIELGELAFYDESGKYIDPSNFTVMRGGESEPLAAALFDEQDEIPAEISYLNSMYFDEIYHGRTAREFLMSDRPYENTHPPLGKIIISLGITMFGMTPFGWRFPGVVFGILMVPFMYVFIKNLFGKTSVAVMGTLLFSFDFMHFVQTRISTIDTYGVFFTILMYFFMYRFISADTHGKLSKQLVPLALCGLSFGLGIASKWTCFYAAAGLVVLYAIYFAACVRRRCSVGRLLAILGVSVMFFVVVSAAIYYFSYFYYARGLGKSLSLEVVWENQVGMFSYHSGLESTHPYASTWYMWLVNARPILYYRKYIGDNLSLFAAWLNPVVCWAGLVAIPLLCGRLFKRKADGRALFIVIGYMAQFAPWVLITRTTFAYHYFPSMVFLVLALAWVMNLYIDAAKEDEIPAGSDGALDDTGVLPGTDMGVSAAASKSGGLAIIGRTKTLLYNEGMRYSVALTAFAVVLFLAFFPALTGLPAPAWYFDMFLGWLPSWPI